MGLYKIDNVSSEEWQRRMMRRHEIKRWLITLGQIALMTGTVMLIIWIVCWAMGEVHP